ncbi:MAG: dihydroneopterin aldolase [Bacteroidales bacterium]|nr:dihydroneopterin aldolase [Bacteroidales bacterium]
MSVISIEGMEFFGHHGCYEEERTIGGRFMVDLVMETDTSLAESTDQLADTVDYHAVYMVVRDEMSKTSLLLEHLARRILDRISASFPGISAATLTLSKLSPPMNGAVSRVSVTLRSGSLPG